MKPSAGFFTTRLRLPTLRSSSNHVFDTRFPYLNFGPCNASPGYRIGIVASRQSFLTLCSSNSSPLSATTPMAPTNRLESTPFPNAKSDDNQWNVQVAAPAQPSNITTPKFSLSDQAFFLLAFISCTTSIAFVSLVIAAVPTLFAMGRAANSLSKLADTAREELPSTMAAIRLSGMEISDLTLELSDLSQEIAYGVNKSSQAVQAAQVGIRKIGHHAHQQTMSIIQERASLPDISWKPVISSAAKKTSHAVGIASKTLTTLISRGVSRLGNEDGKTVNRIEI